MNFKDAAEKVLQDAKTSLHYSKITELALGKGLIKTKGSTPENTMAAQIYQEILNDKSKERQGRFIRTGRGIFGLRSKTQMTESPKDEEKIADELADLSGLTSTQKGRIVENRIRELILLYGAGDLSVYEPASDIEGIDLVVVKNGVFQPLFLQVKGRYSLNRGSFIADIRLKTFNPHHTYYIVCAYFNPKTLEIDDDILMVPTERLEELGNVVNAGKDKRHRITARLNEESKGKWAPYLCKKADLASKLLEKFEEIEKYYK